MKLHLPKALFTAVMALFAVSQTAWAGWDAGYNDYTDGYVYYLNDTADINAVTDAADYTKLYIQKGDLTAAEVGQFSVKAGDTVGFSANTGESSAGNLTGLTIGTLDIADSGTASVDVRASQVVAIKDITGTISNLSVGGNLTIGKTGDTSTEYTITNGSVSTGGQLTLAGGITTIGASSGDQTFTPSGGELIVNSDATLKFAKNDVLSWGTNKITLNGGTWDAGTTRQSVGGETVINLIGGTIKSNTYGDGNGVVEFLGGTLQSSGASSITGAVQVDWDRKMNVNVLDGTLSIDTIINRFSSGHITKSGDGTLKLTSMSSTTNSSFYQGDTEITGGTIEYAIDKKSEDSTSDGSYAGTISGTGNIAKSGTGTVTLANISGLDGDISVSGGTLNITSLTATKTLDVSVSGGTLSINSITVDTTNNQLSVKEGSSATSYYTTDGTESGKNDLQNGFVLTSGEYVLFNDYVWSGTVDGWSVSNDGTNTYLTSAGTIGTEYYITSGEVSVGASTGAENYIVQGGIMNLADGSVNVDYTSGSIVLATAAGIKLTSADNLTNIVSNTAGTGTISIADSATLNQGTYTFAGTLDVAAGKQLNYGNAQSQAVAAADATVRLGDNSVLYVESYSSTLGVLDVQGNATLRAYDSDNATSPALTIGEVKIAAGKTLGTATNWEGMMVINKLNAEGTLNSAFNGKSPLVINTIEKSGAINNTNAAATMTLGADGSSVLNLGGDVTNTGTLNIKGELAGTSTISGGTINVESTASISGAITFGSDFNLAETITSTGSVTLGGNVNISSLDVLEDGGVAYSANDGQDGYITNAVFYIVKGDGAATATLSGDYSLKKGEETLGAIAQSTDGKSLVLNINGTGSGTWYINTQDFTVDGSADNLAKDATDYHVAAGKTLTISAAQSATMTTGKILTTATGGGNITLDADATVGNNEATKATGKLTINSGKTLEVGKGTGQTASIASFSSVDLNGGTLRMHNNGSTVNNLTVGSESTLRIQDAANANSTTLLAGTITLNAELNVTSGFKGTLTVDKLTGTGNLDIDAGDNGYNDTLLVNINKLQNYSGVIGYKASGNSEGTSTKTNNVINIKNTTDNNAYGAINIGGLTLENSGAAFATANLDMGRNDNFGANSLGAVSISGGSVLSMFNRGNDAVVNMSSLTVTGAATVQTKRDGSCYQGIVNIASLANGGDDAATLNLVSGSKATAIMAYNLNGGDGFTGTINVKGDAASGGSRRVALNINAENAAKGAVINFLDATTDAANDADENYTALGLGSNATVAGLGAESVDGAAPVLTTNAVTITGYKIKANEKDQFATRDDADTGTSARTLTINAADSKEYSVKANVGADVNLTQSGAGTQNISGDQSAMNGTLEASAGALNITNTGNAMSLAGVKATGGIVQVNDATNAVTVADMTVSNDGQVKGNSMTVTNSMTISNSGAFDLTGALVMSGATVDLSGFTLDTTTAQDTYVYTLGMAAGGITADESISFTGINVDGYTATLVAAAADPTASAVMLLDGAATNNYLVLTLTKDDDTPAAPALTTINVNGVDVNSSSAGALTLTTAENATDAVFGGALDAVMDDTTWADIKAELKKAGITLDDSIAVTFVGADGVAFDFDGADNNGTAPVVTINGEVTRDANLNAVGQTLTNNGTAVGNYVTAYIPEPTSTTLSLLALAALAVRRRRK